MDYRKGVTEQTIDRERNSIPYPEDSYAPKKSPKDLNVIKAFSVMTTEGSDDLSPKEGYDHFDGYLPPPPPPPVTGHRSHNEMSPREQRNRPSYQSPEWNRYDNKHLIPQNLPLNRNTSKNSIETDI